MAMGIPDYTALRPGSHLHTRRRENLKCCCITCTCIKTSYLQPLWVSEINGTFWSVCVPKYNDSSCMLYRKNCLNQGLFCRGCSSSHQIACFKATEELRQLYFSRSYSTTLLTLLCCGFWAVFARPGPAVRVSTLCYFTVTLKLQFCDYNYSYIYFFIKCK
jgi:hypothetical protein